MEDVEATPETLLVIVNNEKAPAAARVVAACAILDRGWGKPGQYIETSVRNKPIDELTDEEFMAIAAGGDSDDEPEAQCSDKD